MITEIIASRPPNYLDIVKAFPLAARPGTIFAYSPHIYYRGGKLAPALITHEEVHIRRQNAIGVEKWWENYLTDTKFRYDEELLAHRAEYQHMITGGTRQIRRSALKIVAKRLQSQLYGGIVTLQQAMEQISAP